MKRYKDETLRDGALLLLLAAVGIVCMIYLYHSDVPAEFATLLALLAGFPFIGLLCYVVFVKLSRYDRSQRNQ